MRNRFCLAMALASLGGLSSCGGGSNSGGSVINMAGNWAFNAPSTFDLLTAQGQIDQDGSSLSGTLTLGGTLCAQTADLTGNLTGTDLTATLDANGTNILFKGTVAANGSSASGTFTTPAGGCTNGISGTFTGQRLSMLNGMFIGSFGPENSIPANIVTQLHDEGGNVTGSATITNSLCFHSMNVTGKVSGFTVELQGADDLGEPHVISLRGTVSQPSKSLALNYTVSGGSCSGETGTAQLRLTR